MELPLPHAVPALAQRTVQVRKVQNRPVHIYDVNTDKKSSILHWVRGQKDLHCMMPNDDCTILPFPTKQHAHAAMVQDKERLYGCAWWTDSSPPCAGI